MNHYIFCFGLIYILLHLKLNFQGHPLLIYNNNYYTESFKYTKIYKNYFMYNLIRNPIFCEPLLLEDGD